MTDFEKLRQDILTPLLKTVRIVRPKIAYRTALDAIIEYQGTPYKIVRWEEDTAYCQMLTNEELHSLTHRH